MAAWLFHVKHGWLRLWLWVWVVRAAAVRLLWRQASRYVLFSPAPAVCVMAFLLLFSVEISLPEFMYQPNTDNALGDNFHDLLFWNIQAQMPQNPHYKDETRAFVGFVFKKN